MKNARIYLRSIKENSERHLSLYDSEGNGGIDDLTTIAVSGSTVYWELDCNSNIKEIESIYPKNRESELFREGPKKCFLRKCWKLKVPKDFVGTEKYGIIYKLCDGTSYDIDPQLDIKPPIPKP